MDKQPRGEPRIRTAEIIRNANFTALVNPSVAHRQDVRQLIGDLKDGIPPSWTAVEDPRWKRNQVEADPIELDFAQWVDNKDHPHFFAKARSMGTPAWVRPTKDMDKNYLSDFGFTKREHYSFASLRNEINLAQKIKESLASKEAKKLADGFDIEEITFVEPLVGLINRTTGQKIMVYDFIEGYGLSDLPELSQLEFNQRKEKIGRYDDFAYGLYKLFVSHGIRAVDLRAAQFLFDKANPRMLYLIDIEGYHTIPQHSE